MAGGTAVLAQRVLEAVFGDQAIRRLAQTAKEELDARVQALMSAELLRYHQVLDGLAVSPSRPSGCVRPRPRCSRRGPTGCPRLGRRAGAGGRDEAALPRPRSGGRSSRRG